MRHMVREENCLELFGQIRVEGRAHTVTLPVTLVRMNLAYHLNAIGTFSKVMR